MGVTRGWTLAEGNVEAIVLRLGHLGTGTLSNTGSNIEGVTAFLKVLKLWRSRKSRGPAEGPRKENAEGKFRIHTRPGGFETHIYVHAYTMSHS